MKNSTLEFDVKKVPEVEKLLTQLEQLRADVVVNEKIESDKIVEQEETMKRIEQLFLEADKTN